MAATGARMTSMLMTSTAWPDSILDDASVGALRAAAADAAGSVERALEVTREDYEESVAGRERYRDEAREALDGFDLLVVPGGGHGIGGA